VDNTSLDAVPPESSPSGMYSLFLDSRLTLETSQPRLPEEILEQRMDWRLTAKTLKDDVGPPLAPIFL
jgi:hypothetical protein